MRIVNVFHNFVKNIYHKVMKTKLLIALLGIFLCLLREERGWKTKRDHLVEIVSFQNSFSVDYASAQGITET